MRPLLPTRRTPHHAFAWLLWLALVLPVAQVAASVHALSHLAPAAAGDDDGKRAPHTAHCDRCLAAAAVGGGAPITVPLCWLPPDLHHAAPNAAVGGVAAAAAVRTYLSRAPPLARA